MDNKRGKYVSPSINETAFNCLHCGALAQQSWFKLAAHLHGKDELPDRFVDKNPDFSALNEMNHEERVSLLSWYERVKNGLPALEQNKIGRYYYFDIFNVNVSQCFNCSRISFWVGSGLVWPAVADAPLANPDLSDEVRLDFEEAGRILNLSPRGAAALLRLAIQKLCKELGEKGKNINDDIAALVKKGLDVRVQQALDVVRVIGNQAVHPGQIDLRDDRSTAEQLFGLVNLIADIMITQPKHISAMFERLPENIKSEIHRRDNNNG